jgi:hypothetical protein
MTRFEAISILNRVRAGDTSPSLAQITLALAITGDLV